MFGTVRAVPRLGICLTTDEKARKNLSTGKPLLYEKDNLACSFPVAHYLIFLGENVTGQSP
jgi:hypothetical protein